MQTNIKIKSQSGIKGAGYHYGGFLDVWTKEGFRRYQARAAIKKLDRLYSAGPEIEFQIELIGGVSFTGATHPVVFSQLESEYKRGPQPGDFPVMPNAKPPSGHAGQWLVVVAIVGLLLWVIFGGSSGTSTPQPAKPDILTASTAEVMTKTLCELKVKDALKAPSTADFPFFSQAVYDGRNSATLSSYVDAQNSFGAMIRTKFVCKATYQGGDTDAFENWKIVDFVILE